MSEIPEALRLADWHESVRLVGVEEECWKAATELRRLHADNERLREALEKSLTDEQIKQIAALIDRAMPLESAKILFARAIEAALKEVPR